MNFRIKTWLCLLALVAFGALGANLAYRSRPVQFDTVAELQELANASGLHWHWKDRHNRRNTFLFVSDRPLDWEQIDLLQTRSATKKADWRGIVCAMHVGITFTPFAMPEPVGGMSRRWGDLLVAGDEEFMNRVEQLYRSR